MINPNTRSSLSNALTPPAGFRFDCGLATTYTLDPTTLLSIPLHLAWLSSGEDKTGFADPLRLLEALRRTADRLTVFVDHGRLQIPSPPHSLIGLLENMIFEARAPHGGAFHPKIWLLRFISDDPANRIFRLLILSRNITTDRSWDISLQLEGTPGGGNVGANRILGEFFAALPDLSSKAMPESRKKLIQELALECRRCHWELPLGFDDLAFHILGMGRRRATWLPGESDELAVISPFVGRKALDALRQNTRTPLFLLSRPEELDTLAAEDTGAFEHVLVLDEQAEISDEEDDRVDQLRGLHAKVIVQRRGWNTHLFIGSANATDAALLHGANVEIMAELIGRHSRVGRPERWLDDEGMKDIITPYMRSITSDQLLADRRAEDVLEHARQRLADAGLSVRCEAAECDWRLCLDGAHDLDLGNVDVTVWPLTVPLDRGVPLRPLLAVDLGTFATQDVTSLIGFGLEYEGHTLRFGLDLPLLNPPADRDAALIRLVLRNRDGFVRYLMLLLAEWTGDQRFGAFKDGAGYAGSTFGKLPESPPLFELLTAAYARDPNRVTEVNNVIARLKGMVEDGGEPIIPAEFMNVWRVFEEAMQDGRDD